VGDSQRSRRCGCGAARPPARNAGMLKDLSLRTTTNQDDILNVWLRVWLRERRGSRPVALRLALPAPASLRPDGCVSGERRRRRRHGGGGGHDGAIATRAPGRTGGKTTCGKKNAIEFQGPLNPPLTFKNPTETTHCIVRTLLTSPLHCKDPIDIPECVLRTLVKSPLNFKKWN
jgi:hypothetical protein